MDHERNDLTALFPSVAAQMRAALSSLHLASAQLVPASLREQDPALDMRAAQLDKSYYQLLHLVNDLTLAAHLNRDQPLHLRDRELVSFVGELCEQASGPAALLGLELRFLCSAERLVCAVSPDALEQILSHLLSNAFKFTPAGGSVTVELRAARGKVLLSVEDTGCGIPEKQLSSLFDRPLRPESPPAPPTRGLGLGLALCRRLAEEHGGSILVESRPGKGSRFTLSLPEKQVGSGVSDVPFDYSGGFNRTLMAFADILPARAFLLRQLD